MRSLLFALPILAVAALSARGDDFLAKNNWEGLTEYWKVDGNTVTGTTPQDGLKFNTFLCSKGKYKDFELKFQVRLKGGVGNSGIQIRSKIHDMEKFAVTGPQCDMGAGWWGSLYGENFGGMMKAADKDKINKVLKAEDFNDYTIKVHGKHGKHVAIAVNGETAVDADFEKMPDEGIIAFQLHGGPHMEVTFKNIEFKEGK